MIKMLDIEKILKLNQEELLDFCYIELMKRGYKNRDIVVGDYVYAKGNIPILLVAHCDIVHKKIPEVIVNDKQKGILWCPTGIGGDDRCGVYAILKICEKFKPYVLFATDEEIGCVGTGKFIKEFDELPVNFIIEIDRRGDKQAVFYDCGNKEFQNYILSFGFNKEIGSCSDVKILSTHYDIAGVNLSAGYYNEHTTQEHIYMSHLQHTIDGVKNILKDTQHHKFFDCQKIKPVIKYNRSYNYDYYDYYDDYDDYGYSGYHSDYWKTKNKPKEIEEKVKQDMKKKEETKTEKVIDKEQKEEYNKENIFTFDEILAMEDDYFDLTQQEWQEKYGYDKPKDILELYDYDIDYEDYDIADYMDNKDVYEDEDDIQ